MAQTIVFCNVTTNSVFNCIVRHRQQYAKWGEVVDCLLVDDDLPDYREAYEIERGFSREETRVLILASMLESYYEDIRPELECPFSVILSEGLTEVNWLDIAKGLLERVRNEREKNQ